MAIAAIGNNLITYVFNEMHFPLSKSANIVTNFIGTVFLLSLLGGFLSDSYLGSFWTMLTFGFVELSVSLSFSLISVVVLCKFYLPSPRWESQALHQKKPIGTDPPMKKGRTGLLRKTETEREQYPELKGERSHGIKV